MYWWNIREINFEANRLEKGHAGDPEKKINNSYSGGSKWAMQSTGFYIDS